MKLLSLPTCAILGLILAASQPRASAVPPFKVIGYVPSWAGNLNGVQFGKVTHLNYAFLSPNSNGSLQAIDNPTLLQNLVSSAHGAKVSVSISIAGASAFASLSANSGTTTTFVNNVVSFVNQYNLDGIDIDWEFPSTGSQATNYASMMSQLSSAMHSRGKLLTAAVIAWGGDSILSSVFNSVDWINLMDYDNTNGVGQSTYQSAIDSFNYWVNTRGCPVGKTVLGVPFYSDPSGTTFSQLLSEGASPNSDSFGSEGYNGIPTIQAKTNLCFQERCGGIMIWTVSYDASGANSLLSAIDQVVQANAVPIGKMISLQANINSLWVSATNDGASPLVASASTPQLWEEFVVVDESAGWGTGYVALRSMTNGLYVSAGPGGNSALTANSSTVSNTEAFFWQPNGNGTVNLQSAANGLWVSATNAGASSLVASAPTPRSWELYTLKLWSSNTVEVEGLTVQSFTSGDTAQIITDTNFSAGAGVQFFSNAVGDQITFVVPNVEAGTYDVQIGVKKYTNRGIWQLAIGPAGGSFTNFGAAQDNYASTATFTTIDLGNWTPGTTSSKWFKFTITGKNASSAGYNEVIDFIRLIPQ